MRLALLTLSACLAGCAAMPTNPARWTSKHPDWHPPQGIEYAIAQCKAKSEGVSGYDWADKAINKSEAMTACMEAYGYQ